VSDRPALWFPLALLAALAALTTWLDLQVRNSMTEAANRDRHDPDTILHDFVTHQTDGTGRVETTLSAHTMRRFMDDQSSEFEQPKIVRRNAKGVLLDIRSDRGRASGDRKTLEFEGRVTLHQSGSVKTPAKMETTYLRVLPQKNLAMTDEPVRFTSAGTLVTGHGLDFDLDARTVKIRSRVKVTYRPSGDYAAATPATPAPRRADRGPDRRRDR